MTDISNLNAVKIAAVIPCHNHGRFLSECLESLFCQSLPFAEIIVVNDASDDETAAVCRSYVGRIKYIEVNYRNAVRAREAGIREACAEFIVPVDADNWLSPEYNEKMIAPLLADKGLGFTYCGKIHHYETAHDREWGPKYESPMLPYDKFLLGRLNYIDSCSCVRREAWLGENAELDGYIDWQHWLRLAKAGWSGQLVPERLIYYRIHKQTLCYELQKRAKADVVAETLRPFKNDFLSRERELTILCLFSGKAKILPLFLQTLDRLRKPQDTQLLFIDNSRNSDFHRLLKEYNPATFRHPRPLNLPEQYSNHKDVCRVIADHCGGLYNYAKKYVQGKNTLILEDDILPPEGAYENLLSAKNRYKTDLMAGVSISRLTGRYQAWRLRGLDAVHGVYSVPVRRSPKRVFATAFGCLLLDSEILDRLNFRGTDPNYPFYGCDLFAGLWAHENDKRWFVHGGVRCTHLNMDKSRVKLGQDIRSEENLKALLVASAAPDAMREAAL